MMNTRAWLQGVLCGAIAAVPLAGEGSWQPLGLTLAN
jgi:hypothetical protein